MVNSLQPADEVEHADVAVESWWWWGANDTATIGVFVGLEVRGARFDYWCGVVREGSPYLYVDELDGIGRRDGLEVKPAELWADHVCDVPFRQWSVSNETYGVMIDDPSEVCGRAYGRRLPVAIDIEWAATDEPVPEPGANKAGSVRGYRQRGEVDVVVETGDGPLRFTGPGQRAHHWATPYVPCDLALPADAVVAPYRRSDGRCVTQMLTTAGWFGRVGNPSLYPSRDVTGGAGGRRGGGPSLTG